jgi:hypothetical protein
MRKVKLILRKALVVLFKLIPKKVIAVGLSDPSNLRRASKHGFYMVHSGYCPCCCQEVNFYSDHSWLRDNLLCKNCGSIPRERALMLVLEKHYPNWQELSIHESSPGGRGASRRLKNGCINYTASQFYPGHPTGSRVNGSRNEDLEQQTFVDESFDLVVTQDVMEHIYEPSKAFSEIARTLKNGGAHIFTVPIINKFKPTEVWAKKGADGKPVFLHKPEYHGNPVDPLGSPVTMHWGYDIVEFIKKESGLVSQIEYINDLHYGVRAEYIEVIVTKKI